MSPPRSPPREGPGLRAGTDLCPDLQHILEADGGVGQLCLQHGDDVLVVFRDLLAADARIQVRLRERLQLGDLRVERGDILLDDVGELLYTCSMRMSAPCTSPDPARVASQQRKVLLEAGALVQRLTLISTGRSSNKVLRFATVAHEQSSVLIGQPEVSGSQRADAHCASFSSLPVVA